MSPALPSVPGRFAANALNQSPGSGRLRVPAASAVLRLLELGLDPLVERGRVVDDGPADPRRVDQQLLYTKGASVGLAPLKTSASYRTVPLPRVIGEAIAAHLARWPADPGLGLVFTNERGAPIQARPFSVAFARARDAAGLPAWVTPHDWRHHYASLLIRSAASVKVVQSRLGHASATTTLDTCGHLFPDEEDRTRGAVDAAFQSLADSSRTATTDAG